MGIAKEHHPIREPVCLVLVSVLAPWIPPRTAEGIARDLRRFAHLIRVSRPIRYGSLS